MKARLPRRFQQLLAFDHAERQLLLHAYVSLVRIHVALRVVGFQRLAARPGDAPPDALGTSCNRVLRARRYAHWIDVASRHHVVPARCLHRSLVLQDWLQREGVAGLLRIGVRMEHGALKAHAWIELDGQVVNDDPTAVAAFAPLVGGHRPAGGRSMSDLVTASVGVDGGGLGRTRWA